MPGEDTVLTRVGGLPTVTSIEDNTRRYSNAVGGVAVGDAVYISSSLTVSKADADDINKRPPIGVVALLDGSDHCYVCHSGGSVFKSGWGLSVGDTYWLGTSAGVITNTKPSPPNLLFLIGIAISANLLLINCIPTEL